MISLGVATSIQVMSNLANTKDVDEIGMIGSLSNVFKSVHDKSPEVGLSFPFPSLPKLSQESVSESHSLTGSSIATKNSRNLSPPDSRRDSGDETVQTGPSAGGSVAGMSGVLSVNSTGSPSGPSDRFNEKLVTSLRMSPSSQSVSSPTSFQRKRFMSIPTILEAAPESPSAGGRGMKRRGSKTFEELAVLTSVNPRNAFEKHRPKSFTLAPNTPLTPAVLSLFDQLPSEQYTINHIMQVKTPPSPSLCPSSVTHLSVSVSLSAGSG
jgi:hypothetical protein